MNGDTITLALAIWGALVSTVLAARTVLREQREDGRVRVRAFVGTITGGDSIKPFCIFEVVNIGRRRLLFKGLYLFDRNGKSIDQVLGPFDDGNYESLEPGAIVENVEDAYRDVERILRIRRVCAVDTLNGRTYLPRWRTWHMRIKVARILARDRALKRERERDAGVNGSHEEKRPRAQLRSGATRTPQ